MDVLSVSSRSVEVRKHGAAIARSLEAGARALSAADMRLEQRAQEALAKQRRARDRTLEEALLSENRSLWVQFNEPETMALWDKMKNKGKKAEPKAKL